VSLYDLPVVVSPALPIIPTDAENIVRMVRHGLADALAWLGEDVGPKPGDCTHAVEAMGTLFVSQEMHDKLADSLEVPRAR
jgi:hypothetical protein